MTRQPALTSASNPARRGVLREPKSKISAARRPPRQYLEQLRGDGQRRRENDEVEIQGVGLPIVHDVEARQAPFGIRNGNPETLRGQKVGKPAAHLAVAADDQRALAAAMRLRRHAGLLLRGQRRLNQLPQQRLGEVGRDFQPVRRGAAPQDDFPFPAEVAGGPPGGPLDGGHLLAQGLAPRHQFQQLAVQVSQCRSEFVQIHI